ncbi:reticulocyte-binding protein homolog 1-like [Prorops nasuta]|uniref:reticulocyte-binding protein homolog 1-like n=1 Tax=Prorops nasuta TaxID=863751 RepID=UPI0034CF70CE
MALHQLSSHEIDIIRRREWLTDGHMDYFALLLEACSNYKPRNTWRIQLPGTIEPVSLGNKHIQILHSSQKLNTNIDGNWQLQKVQNLADPKKALIRTQSNNDTVLPTKRAIIINDSTIQQEKSDKNQFKSDNILSVDASAIIVSAYYSQENMQNTNQSNIQLKRPKEKISDKSSDDSTPKIKRMKKNKNYYEKHKDEILLKKKDRCHKNKQNILDLTEQETSNKKQFKSNNILSVDVSAINVSQNYKTDNIRNTNKKNIQLKRSKEQVSDKSSDDSIHKIKRTKKHKSYYENHKDKILLKKRRYREKKKKAMLDSTEKKIKHKTYYHKYKNKILSKKKDYYKRNRQAILDFIKKRKSLEDQFNSKLNINTATNIVSKYKNIIVANNTIKMKQNVEKYIVNITKDVGIPSITECRLQAQRIVKWCMYIRKTHITHMQKVLKQAKQKAEISITRYNELKENESVENIPIALCGKSRHIPSSEPYFYETAYLPYSDKNPIVINIDGKAMNILPLIGINEKNKNKKIWECSSLRKIRDLKMFNILKGFYQDLLNYEYQEQGGKLGHPHICYIDYNNCKSKFLIIEILSSHFIEIRYIKRLIYDLMNMDKNIRRIDDAFDKNVVVKLNEIGEEAQKMHLIFINKVFLKYV